MKYLKNYKNINESSFLTKAKIYLICKKYGLENYTINSDGSIDINNAYLSSKNLNNLPLKFRNVGEYFTCYNNNLINLEGSPTYVQGDFLCDYNKLTSLEGSPTHVGGDFLCNHNKLTSLEGCPISVGGDFLFNNNNIASLEGGPTHVGGDFFCSNNNITGLEGVPLIGGNFYCYNNPVYEIWKLFHDKSKVELFNDYDIIRGTDIVLDRLNDFLINIGIKPVKSVIGYNNI